MYSIKLHPKVIKEDLDKIPDEVLKEVLFYWAI